MAGLIVDTPSSFASGTAASNEDRQRLIRACVEAFKSIPAHLINPPESLPNVVLYSKHDSGRRSRETLC